MCGVLNYIRYQNRVTRHQWEKHSQFWDRSLAREQSFFGLRLDPRIFCESHFSTAARWSQGGTGDELSVCFKAVSLFIETLRKNRSERIAQP